MGRYNELNTYKDEPLTVGNTPYKKQQRFWWHNLVIAGWFLGLISIMYFFPLTEMSLKTLLRFLVFFSLIALVIPYRWYARVAKMGHIEVRLLSLAGMGPLLTGLLLVVNYSFSSEFVEYDYRITGYEKTELLLSTGMMIQLENNAMKDDVKFRTFELNKDMTGIRYGTGIKYELANGALGFKVMKGYKIY